MNTVNSIDSNRNKVVRYTLRFLLMLKLHANKTETGIRKAVNSTITRLIPSKPNNKLQFIEFNQYVSSKN